MPVGQVYYTGWCDDDGKLLDDGTVTRIGEQSFRLTAAEPQLRWLSMNAVGMQVQVTELTEQMAALSLQGPKSRTILNLALRAAGRSAQVFPHGVQPHRRQGRSRSRAPVTPAISATRSGWTRRTRSPIWDALMAAGHDYGITPTGILAMDMARVEAGLFMLDVDYTSASHAWIPGQRSSPYEMGLGWTVNLDKQGYFVGRRALEREHREGSSWKMVGLEIDWEGLEREYAAVGLPPQIPAMAVRGSIPVYTDPRQVGYASTSTWSPVLKKYIALVHLQQPYYEPGTQVEIEVTVEHHRRQSPGDGRRAAVLRPRVEEEVTVASNTLRRDRHRRRPQRHDRGRVPRARRQEGRRARAARDRRRRRRHRGDLPGLPLQRVLLRGEPAAARDHPRPRAAAARAQDPAAAEHGHAARQRRLPRRLGRPRPDPARDLPSFAARTPRRTTSIRA